MNHRLTIAAAIAVILASVSIFSVAASAQVMCRRPGWRMMLGAP